MNLILKNWPSLLLLCAGIAACYATFVSSNNDQLQKDSIENLGTENKKLSEEVIKLNTVSNNITSRIKELTETNNKLAQQSQDLINKIESRTAYETAQNLQTAELKMIFSAIVKESDRVTVKMGGGISVSHTIKKIKEGARLISIDDKDALSMHFDKNNKMLFSINVYDIEGRLIAEIEKNNWRSNKNLTGKFNYDDRGFEVIDNNGNVAINVNIIDNNNIIIHGIFPIKGKDMVLIYADNSFSNPTLPSTSLPYIEYKRAVNEIIDRAKITPIFKYTGENWLHSRAQ